MFRFNSIGAAVLAAIAALGGHAQDAANRGITDSVVSTLVGGIGDGLTNAKNVVFSLNGGIARDSSGNIYCTEFSRVLKLTPTGALSNFVGTANTNGFSGDGGPASSATLNSARSLAIDPNN